MPDKVQQAVRLAVLARDRRCFVVRVDPRHVCRDQWGIPHPSDDDRFLTLDHVKDGPMMGRRAPSDVMHMVAMCHAANVSVPSKELRAAERAYLAKLYPAAWRRKGEPVYDPADDQAGDGSDVIDFSTLGGA